MASILDTITQQLGGDTVRQVSQQLGTDEATAGSAISAALPVLMAALARNASNPGGADALAGALDRDHDGSALNDLTGTLSRGQGGIGDKILGHVLGNRRGAVEEGLGQATGLGAGGSGKLLAMLAPIIMGALGRAKREQGLDAGGIGSMLGAERSRIGAAAPAGVGGLLQFLDADKDGSVMDDVTGMLGKFMGGR